jgi:8-oxo-dGTP pyrophosphatase MutT (NUDIX family)
MAEESPDTHAGGVVYRESAHGPEYLIVRARRDPHAWVLPKGHIEPGESPEQAAVREVEEEAGCRAAVVTALGPLVFGTVRTRVYLMRFEREVPREEDRELFWGPVAEASRRLTYPDTRQLVTLAHEIVTRGDRDPAAADRLMPRD